MATGTVYLDVDDEITSAAARIRGSEATKVALVVPHGSRIATSRMNFRLLSREAVVNNRRLSIVAADPATRALAASAGLPVFPNVGEWEASGGNGGGSATAGRGAPDDDAALAGPEPAAEPEPATESPPVGPPSKRSRRGGKPRSAPDDAPTLGLPAATAAAATAAAAAADSVSASSGMEAAAAADAEAGTGAAALPRTPPPPSPAVGPGGGSASRGRDFLPHARPAGDAARPAGDVSRLTVVRGRTLPRVGAPAAIVAGALVLALVVLAVGAYVFLPSATIVVTPREEGIGPIALVVRADPDVATPDASANVVPALLLNVPVEVSDTFPTKGKRVVETQAKGTVTFESYNFLSSNTIPAGSVVSTEGGIGFVTQRSVTLPKATFVPPIVTPSKADVAVTAAKPGTAGNVPANAIRVVPKGEDPEVTKVRNPEATSGGTHEEFPQIQEAEVTAAIEALKPKLTEAFTAAVAAGAGAPVNAEVFDETAALGEPSPTVDPATLVGKEQESFELGLSANGTVIAVDSSPVEKIAETRLLSNVGADHRLVEGSVDIVSGDPTVTNGEVSFPVTARATKVRILDPAELLRMVKGRSVDDARSLLGEFGDVEVTTWPDWVSAVPSIDSRVTIEIVGQTEGAVVSPRPSSSARPSGPPKPAATTRPSDEGGSPSASASGGAAAPSASAAP